MEAWDYKTREQWQQKIDRTYGAGRFEYVTRGPILSGLWADVKVFEIAARRYTWIRLYF